MSQTITRDLLDKCLEELENRIDPVVEEDLYTQWQTFTDGKFRGDVFRASRIRHPETDFKWPKIMINQAQDNEEAMLLSEYASCFNSLRIGGGHVMCVRSNYGTGILPTLFGAELFLMDDALNTLQTTQALPDVQAIESVVKGGLPSMTAGLGKKVLDTGRRFAQVARQYPKIGKYVHIYHPDLQSPMDVVELLWGSSLFLDVMDHPERVHALLQLVTDTYVSFMREWEAIVPAAKGNSIHWSAMHRGKIMLRDDSGMNFSPAMYDEFMRPYDSQLLKKLGGGAVHFCGRGDHYIESCCQMEGLYAINTSQPHYNDMETIFRNTVDKGIKLIGLDAPAVTAALERGRDLHGCVHTW